MRSHVLSIALLCVTLFAAYLGLFAQDIAYYFTDDYFSGTPFQILIIVTLTSIGLFIIVCVVEMILLARKRLKANVFARLFIANLIIGCFVSIWSLFVLMMWWG